MTAIIQFANWTAGNALGVYYQSAAHRLPHESLSLSSLLPSTFENVTDALSTRPFHFLRGMMHFEPGPPYLHTLRAYGFDPRIFHFEAKDERNLLRLWTENTGDVLRRFARHPEAVGTRPVFCGHSAGGLTVYALASVAKGGNAEALRSECPGLNGVTEAAFGRLREALSQALFVTVASPLRGIRMTGVGRCINRALVEPRAPSLFSGLWPSRLEALYRKVGRRPEEVIDVNLVGNRSRPSLRGGSLSWMTSLVIQGGMRVFSPFLDHDAPGDGIVPMDAAMLPKNGKGPAQGFAPFDHLNLVETSEAAMTLMDLLRQADPYAEKLS